MQNNKWVSVTLLLIAGLLCSFLWGSYQTKRLNVLKLDGTGGLILPKGTAAQRPAGERAFLRYNTEAEDFEGHFSSGWAKLLGVSHLGKVLIVEGNNHLFETSSKNSFAKATIAGVTASDKGHVGALIITAVEGDIGFGLPSVGKGRLEVTAHGRFVCQYDGKDVNCSFGISDDNCATVAEYYSVEAVVGQPTSYISTLSSTFTYATDQGAKEFVICAQIDQNSGIAAIDIKNKSILSMNAKHYTVR